MSLVLADDRCRPVLRGAARSQLITPKVAGSIPAYEGMRPGELDALTWQQLDFQAGTIHVDRQWNAKECAFTLPKPGVVRTIALTDPVRERLLAVPRESEYLFTTLRGSHYRSSSGSWHWNRARCAAGLGNVDLYTSTRH